MLQTIEKIEAVIKKYLGYVLIVLLIACAIAVSWGVFTRYVLNAASPWTFEFSGFCLAWITFVGSAYALFTGRHIRFESLYDKLPGVIQLAITTIFNAAMALFLVYLSYYGYFLAMRSMGDDTISLPLTKGYFFIIIPIGGALMVLALVFDTLKAFLKRTKAEAADVSEERLI